MTGRLAARLALAAAYGVTLIVSRVARRIRPPQPRPVRRVVLLGRFDNPGWFRAHITPLCRIPLDEILVVTDSPLPADPPVWIACPPRWMRPIGRAAAKFIWLCVTARRRRPDLFVGFHLFPGAISALMAARLFGRPACYQMTGGEIEVKDGGVGAENGLMALLGRRSDFIERLALRVVREFDLVVVRGSKAAHFLAAHGIARNVTINTASVPDVQGLAERHYDLAFVGRLTPIKQPEKFVEIVDRVSDQRPGVRAVMVGAGPLQPRLQEAISARGLERTIALLGQREDVQQIVADSKVFVLTSRSEGLPIATAEAMVGGAVPVTADVGELSDFIDDGVNGYVVGSGDVDEFAQCAVALLRDDALRARFSRAARAAALRHTGIDAVTERWRRDLRRVGGQAEAEGVQEKGVCPV